MWSNLLTKNDSDCEKIAKPNGGKFLKKKIPEQMEEDAEFILHRLEDADGFLPYHDKSSPEEIKSHFHMSKNAFKRAIGRLMKEGYITIEKDGIRLK